VLSGALRPVEARDGAVPPERQIKLDVRRAGDWEVAKIAFHDEVAWMTSARADAIVVFFEGDGAVVLDVDFVIVAP
jgi:hypothetical protein